MNKNYKINDGIIYNKIIIDNNIFIVSNSPNDSNLKKYINYLESEETDIIIRVCEKNYNEKNRIALTNQPNHKDPGTPLKNYENHENHTIAYENHKNYEILRILCKNN